MRALLAYGWGFAKLELDRDLLAIGKVGLSRATALLPDGTPLELPADDHLPTPVDVGAETKNEIVYLTLPVRASGQQDMSFDDKDGLTRHALREVEIRDETSAQAGDTALLQVAAMRPEFRLESATRDGLVCLGMARISEVRSDKQVVLDDNYIPPMLDARQHARLEGVITQVRSLLEHRGQELGGRVSASGRGGAAEIADFLMLQIVNRYEPLFSHYAVVERLHPQTLYETAIQLGGELSTFNEATRSPSFPKYDHDNLETVFGPVLLSIRDGLERVIVRRAEPIDLKVVSERQLYSAHIADSSLIDGAVFVLGVGADVPGEKLRSEFPNSVKLAAQEDIREVVKNLLPGIRLEALAVAPRQIPYHTGNVYFELDTQSELWQGLHKTGGLVIHLDQKLPPVELELWAIRR